MRRSFTLNFLTVLFCFLGFPVVGAPDYEVVGEEVPVHLQLWEAWRAQVVSGLENESYVILSGSENSSSAVMNNSVTIPGLTVISDAIFWNNEVYYVAFKNRVGVPTFGSYDEAVLMTSAGQEVLVLETVAAAFRPSRSTKFRILPSGNLELVFERAPQNWNFHARRLVFDQNLNLVVNENINPTSGNIAAFPEIGNGLGGTLHGMMFEFSGYNISHYRKLAGGAWGLRSTVNLGGPAVSGMDYVEGPDGNIMVGLMQTYISGGDTTNLNEIYLNGAESIVGGGLVASDITRLHGLEYDPFGVPIALYTQSESLFSATYDNGSWTATDLGLDMTDAINRVDFLWDGSSGNLTILEVRSDAILVWQYDGTSWGQLDSIPIAGIFGPVNETSLVETNQGLEVVYAEGDIVTCQPVGAEGACEHPDYDALMALYNATGGPNWTDNTGWVDGAAGTDCDPCGWYGIGCDGDGRVTCIDLDGASNPCQNGDNGGSNNLFGSLPDLDLPFLTTLSLGWNNLFGPLPDFQGVPNLVIMHLWNNNFSGDIPDFSNLPNVENLVLGWNDFSGTVPDFSNLASLRNLSVERLPNLENNAIPDFSSIPNLTSLSFRESNQSGEFPVFTGLTNLERLVAWGNGYTGDLPVISDNHPNLIFLLLHNNSFSGGIPGNYGDLTNLIDLQLQNNNLVGCIPADLTNLCGQLINGNISNNVSLDNDSWDDFCNLSSGICTCEHPDYDALIALYNSTNGPEWNNNEGWAEGAAGTSCDPCNFNGGTWYGVSCVGGRISGLYLSGNGLSGVLPSQVGSLAEIDSLQLRFNQITGRIPEEIGFLNNMRYLDLSFNSLDGPLPSTIDGLSSLEDLRLPDCGITGPIPPEIGSLPELRYIFALGNEFTGSIPNEIGQLANLEYLDFQNNNLTGPIPVELTQCQALSSLILFGNELSGSIPVDIGVLSELQTIMLAGNNLSGEIPESIGDLTILNTLSIAENNLSGELPFSLENLANLEELNVSMNNLSGELPEWVFSRTTLDEVYLAFNNFSGCYPAVDDLCNLGASLRMDFFPFDNFYLAGNPQLPYSGDYERVCDGEPQIGAPCNDNNPATIGETIQPDCSCGLPVDPCGINDEVNPTITCPDPYTMTCLEAITQGYDQDLTILQPTDILTLTGTPILQDDCPEEDLTLTFQFISDNRDECGEGTAELEFTVTDAGGNSAVCIQEIQFEAVGPVVTLSSQSDIYCDAGASCTTTISYSFSVANTCDPELPSVTVQLDLDATDSNGDGNYTLVDFTAVNPAGNGVGISINNSGNGDYTATLTNLPLGGHALQIIGVDNCGNETPTLYEFSIDAAPVITLSSQDDVFCDFSNTCTVSAGVDFSVGPMCDPTPASVSVELDLDATDSDGDGSYTLADFTPVDANGAGGGLSLSSDGAGGFNLSLTNLPLGNHALRIYGADDCGDLNPVLYRFTVDDCIVNPPTCEESRTVNLEDNGGGTGNFGLLASELILSLPTDCSNANKISIYPPDVYNQPGFQPGVAPIGYEFNCDNLGSNLMRVYVTDDFGNSDFCTVNIDVTDTDAVCSINQPTCSDGIQNGSETGVDCGGPDCEPCTISCADTDFSYTIGVFNLFTGPGNSCFGDEIEVSVSLTATANPPYLVTVREPDGTLVEVPYQEGVAAVKYFPLATESGVYEIISVTDAEGCSSDEVVGAFFAVDQPLDIPDLSCQTVSQTFIRVNWTEDPTVDFYEMSYDNGPVEIVSGGSFLITGLESDQTVSFELTAYPPGNCDPVTAEVNCTTLPDPCTGQEPPVFQPTTVLCSFDGIIDLNLLNDEIKGGDPDAFVKWYRDAAGEDLIADPTFFAPAAAPENLYVVVVRLADVTCISAVTLVVVNYESPVPPSFTNLMTELCANDAIYFLPAPENGIDGTWNLTGTGVVTSINPEDFAGQTLELVFAPDSELCADFFAYEITVSEQTTPDFTNLEPEVCATDGTYTLPARDENNVAGFWSLRENGDLPVTNELDVSERAGETLVYYFQAGSGCSLPYELTISVGEPVVADFSIPRDTVCIDSLFMPVFLGEDAGAVEFLWSSEPAPLVPAGNTATPSLSWSETGDVELTLVIAKDGCTSDPITRMIYVKGCADCARFIDCYPQNGQSVSLILQDVEAPGGAQICLPVMPADFISVVDFGFTIGWDKDVLFFEGIRNINPQLNGLLETGDAYTPLTVGIFNTAVITLGEIPVYWRSFDEGDDCTTATALTLPDATPLFEVCFVPAAVTIPVETSVSFTFGPQVMTVNKPTTCDRENDAFMAGFGASITILPGAASAACDPVRDSSALVELYNTTGGTNWSLQDNNWLTPVPIADWEGVFVNTEGCVTILDLDGVPEGSDSEEPGGINMVGELPNALGQLKSLDSLYLTDNFAVGGGLPDSFYTLPHLYLAFVENLDMTEPISPLLGQMDSLIVFVAEYNQWTFADLLPAEPAFEAIRQVDGAVALQPQDSIFEPVTMILSEGENLDHSLGFELNGNDNTYTWYRNDAEEQEITGGDGVLTINNVQPADAGTYFARITNPGVSGVELFARGVEVIVTAATCDDGVMNGEETGVDCGGLDCPACEACAELTAVIPFPDTTVCSRTNLGYEIRGTGGQPPYQIRFVNELGDTLTINSSLQGGFQAVEGEYTIEVLSVTDADGCTALLENLPLATAVVAEDPELVLLESINPGCGISDGGVVRLVARGGTPPYTFSSPAGDVSVADSIITVTNLPADNHLFRVADSFNCGAPFLFVELTDEPVSLACPQDIRDTVPADVTALTLELPLPETNGCPPGALSYTITGATTASGNGPVGIRNFNVGVSMITYFLGEESCSFGVTIDQLEGPDCSPLSLRNVEVISPTCGQDNGSISFDLVGFTEAFDFTWSSGNEELNPTGLATGLYLLRVQEEETACSFSIGFLMRQSSPVSVSCGSVAASDNTIADGTLLFSVSAATYPVIVVYEGPLSGAVRLDVTAPDTAEIGALLAGDYTITVTDANGCTATCFTTILSAACTDVVIGTTSDISICDGENFAWQGMNYALAGTYFDTLQTTTGCDSILQLNLDLDDSPPVFTVCPPDMEVILNLGSRSSLDLTWPVPVASANCDVFDFAGENTATGVTRDTVITYEATTSLGSTAICSFSIEVIRTDTMTFFVDVENIRRVGQDTMMVPIGVMNFDRGAAFQLHFSLEDESGTGAFLEGINPLHPLLESGLDPEVVNDHTLNLVWFTSNPQPNTFPDSTLLLEIPMVISGDPGACTQLRFVEDLPEVTMAFRLGDEIFPTTVGGQVCLPALADIGGTIVRLDPSFDPQPVPNVEVSLFEPGEQSGLVVTPDDGGYFFLDRLREQPYEIEPFLDRDHLNGVSILDVVLIRNMVIGTINNSSPVSPYQYIAANLQADDCRISVRDLFIEMRMLAGVFETFPGVNSYRFVDARHELPSVEEIRAGNDEWCIFPETITINPLGEDSLSNDFIAVKMGDVSLNARSPRIAGLRSVSIADLRFNLGDTVRVNPRFADDVVAAELRWSFDPRALRPLVPASGNKESLNPADLLKWSRSEMSQVWSDLTGHAELNFIATAPGRIADKLELLETSLGANESGHLFGMELRTGGAENNAMMRVSASPNPFRDEVRVSVNSPALVSTSLDVFDLAGRTLASRQVRLFPGFQTLTIPTADWPAGVYNLHLTSPSGDHWLRLVKH